VNKNLQQLCEWTEMPNCYNCLYMKIRVCGSRLRGVCAGFSGCHTLDNKDAGMYKRLRDKASTCHSFHEMRD